MDGPQLVLENQKIFIFLNRVTYSFDLPNTTTEPQIENANIAKVIKGQKKIPKHRQSSATLSPPASSML